MLELIFLLTFALTSVPFNTFSNHNMSVQSWLQHEEAHGVSQCPAMVTTRRLLVDYLQGDMPASEAASSISTLR